MADDDDDDDLDLSAAVETLTSPDAAYAPGDAPTDRRWPASADGRIDLRTWPHSAQVFMNRAAAEELVRDLTTVLQVSHPTVGVLVEYRRNASGTTVQISTDDADPRGKPA